jgi:NAD(P)-dependent dehydrogenase (short-subunit alcohol dehydrogenase family)
MVAVTDRLDVEVEKLVALHPDDIVYGILYLALDELKFVTGTELTIDGRYTAQ